VHHTIADGWSLGVFLRELMMCYEKSTTGKPILLPYLPIQYADFAYWQSQPEREEAMQASMRYWQKQLGGELPVLELPTDQPHGARQTFSGGTFHFVLSKEITEALEKINQQENATLFMSLLTAFYLVLHRYSGQDEILVGTPVANRNLPELEPLIGAFINTIVLRIKLSGDPGFRALLRQVRDVSLEAYAHQDLPFEKLVEALKPKRDLSRTPIFQVVFNLQNSPMPTLNTPGLAIHAVEMDRGVSQFDITLMVTKSEGRCNCTVEYNSDLFSTTTIARIFTSFQMLLNDAIAHPDKPISQLQILSREELHRLLYEHNQTQFDFPRTVCMHELFEVQVEQTPDDIALIYDEISLSYRELNNRANALAKHLQSLGVGPDIKVGILMEKSAAMVVALLAVLKAGGAYVPIHTSFPAARVQYILKDADVRVLLTNIDPVLEKDNSVPLIYLRDEVQAAENISENPETAVSPDNLAYVIYTSGSTGQPKGVMIQHAALVNFLWSMRTKPGIQKDDVLLTVTSISFDIAALEIFLPLIVGARLVIPEKETTTNPFLLSQAIHRYHVTMMQATPATWQLLIESGWAGGPGLKALCGGEALTRKLADQLLDRVTILWNMYGPTETTIWSSVSRVQKGKAPVTIGQPIGNTQLYILDKKLQPVPIGVVGELHIGGDGLAKGYLNQPLLTNEKFIPDCFSNQPGARLYKTGDIARFLPDGSIEVLGRMDEQVKINGHRIELGEIAFVLLQHPIVQEAVVITRTEASGEKRLVAYYIPNQKTPGDADALMDFMRKKLPVYMTPVAYVRMDAWPLSPNGKIDRKALPLPEDMRPPAGYEAPRNESEQMLAGIWQHVLGVEQVGIHDNFFELGGASIQSLQIVAHANMAGLRLSAESIFEYQTIAELAEQITGIVHSD
jgi:amino acid adenylation domain-containing protein